jgi:D-glycero-D-manno-heptose 1,7-bisphosphate phosphatase
MIQHSAIFFDRDGVLIEDVNLLTRREQVCIRKGVPEALQALCSAGYLLFVVSNQTVVARGLATEDDVENVNAFIGKVLAERSSCRIEHFYYCPHHPEATLLRYRIKCECRKPQPGMLLQAAREYNLDLSNSFMIGDRISDIVAGHKAGCRTILVRTGMHEAKPIVSDAMDMTVQPNCVCEQLSDVVRIILEKE